jgi:hypothetical protein
MTNGNCIGRLPTQNGKRGCMNTLNSTLKSLASAVAAAVITVSMSYGVVSSSNALPWTPGSGSPASLAKVLIQPSQPWFGQPSPAVLVD